MSDVPFHGGQLRQLSERFSIPESQLLDFSANINPDGPPPFVLPALKQTLDEASVLTSYPDLEQLELKRSMSAYAQVSPLSLSIANGFVPLLEATLRALDIKRCVLPVPSFLEYRRTLNRFGVGVLPTKLEANLAFRYRSEVLLEQECDAVLLANPQNPTGILTNRDDLLFFVQHAQERNVRVLLDEAFIDYVPEHSLAADTERFGNLLVFRSVTKLHAMPGMRLAYLVSNRRLARQVDEQLAPWPVTNIAMIAVCAALADKTFVDRMLLLNCQRRALLEKGLLDLGLAVYSSAANFLLMRLPSEVDADVFWTRLILDHHIVARACSNYEGLESGHLRVAVRREEENERLLVAMRTLLRDR